MKELVAILKLIKRNKNNDDLHSFVAKTKKGRCIVSFEDNKFTVHIIENLSLEETRELLEDREIDIDSVEI